MKNMIAAWIAGLVFCIAPAHADESIPLLYSRSNIVIKREHPPQPELLPWQKPEDVPPQTDIALDVEVRDAATFYNQKGWYNLSAPADNSGVLLAFADPAMAPITPSSQYAPLDILMIDKQGKIKQIAPKLVLSDLSEEIYPKDPVQAFLLLRGGACAKLFISPGDTVEYKLFKKPPPVLSTSDNAATPAPAPAPQTSKDGKVEILVEPKPKTWKP